MLTTNSPIWKTALTQRNTYEKTLKFMQNILPQRSRVIESFATTLMITDVGPVLWMWQDMGSQGAGVIECLVTVLTLIRLLTCNKYMHKSIIILSLMSPKSVLLNELCRCNVFLCFCSQVMFKIRGQQGAPPATSYTAEAIAGTWQASGPSCSNAG